MRLLLIALLFTNLAHSESKDQWICTEESSVHQGNALQVCGAGDGPTEGDAREDALKRAINEFKIICSMDSTGKSCNRSLPVNLKRTTCKKDGPKAWKCYRMIEITFQ